MTNKPYLKSIKVHKIPAAIPLRLAVSWLELLREMRETLEMINAFIHGKSVVVVFRDEDAWNACEETLRLDAQASNFDCDLRIEIQSALDGVKEIPNFRQSIRSLLKKLIPMQKRIKQVSE